MAEMQVIDSISSALFSFVKIGDVIKVNDVLYVVWNKDGDTLYLQRKVDSTK